MTRKPDDWMPLHVRKYLGDTMHLNTEQHGAYLLLLMAYWMRGGALPANDNELAAIARVSRSVWKGLRPILEPFFDTSTGKWLQKRAEEELAKARRLTEAKQAAGRKGAENRWQPDSIAMALPLPCHKQTDAPLPLPTPVETKEVLPASAGQSSKRLSYPEDFARFWKEYPTDPNMSKKAAFKVWQRLGTDQRNQAIAAIPGFKRYCEQNKAWYRPIYAEGFLREEKFEGYAAEPAPDPAELAATLDRRDRLLKQGKYAPNYGSTQ